MLAIIMIMSSYYSGEDEERRKQKKTIEPKKGGLTARFQKRIKTLKEKTQNEIPKKTSKKLFFPYQPLK